MKLLVFVYINDGKENHNSKARR